MKLWRILALLAAGISIAVAQELPQSADYRVTPGVRATPFLRYQDSSANMIEVCGTWDMYASRTRLTQSNGVWALDVRNLPKIRPGRFEYKFIVNGAWEAGENRVIFLNDQRQIERPPDVILNAVMTKRDEILVYLRDPIAKPEGVKGRLEPDIPIKEMLQAPATELGTRRGYAIAGDQISFLFDERVYGLDLPPSTRVAVAGNFTGWAGDGGERGQWLLTDDDDDNVWKLTVPVDGLSLPPGDYEYLFRFVVDGSRWLPAPRVGNAKDDGRGNLNLSVDLNFSGATVIKIITEKPLDISQNYYVAFDGISSRKVRHLVNPGPALDAITSSKPLGALLDKSQKTTTYRLFAPRARSVHLAIFDTPEYERRAPNYEKLAPREFYPLWKDDADGVWEITLLGLDTGKYYSFNVDGPAGEGESFFPNAQAGDPYAFAAAHSMNNAIVIDPDATNQWFRGWTDQNWRTPPSEQAVIYETHIRNFTIHPSSRVPALLRGTYKGFSETTGTGVGLDHLKKAGVNMIELMPINEFENGIRDYGWGYSTVFYFAPEASYGSQPLKGSQYYEFKQLVNDLHTNGFGVVLDVVYNHVGGPNIFALIDKKYYFRLTPDYRYMNFSGCGNDVRSEAPMMRRYIVDNILYWMREFHVDGFRFDLGELIDMDTMRAVEAAARAENPNVLLVSEPWSFRGENKRKLKHTGWAAWNNDFRYAAKDFARGRADRNWLAKTMMGSVEIWTANPIQSVNYLESHDDMALADEFCLRPDKNGKYLDPYDVAMNKLAATIVFTSLGVPMLSEGQDFLRSKYGIANTFDKGDAVNALRWEERDRPLAGDAMRYYHELIALRSSPQGAAFRVREKPPADYYKWLLPDERKAFGVLINSPRVHAGNSFILLANAADRVTSFTVNLPVGNWRIVSDGSRVNLNGLPNFEILKGPATRNIKVPELRSLILMDGF